MNSMIHGVYMNLRYRIVSVNQETYIVDLGESILKILFPFLYWVLPNKAYKIEDNELVEQVKAPKVKPKSTSVHGLIAGLLGVLLAGLLQPVVNFFDVEGTPLINSLIVFVAFMVVLMVYYTINQRSRKNLHETIKLSEYPATQVSIKPQSTKHFLFVFFTYLFFLGFTLLMWGGFIQVAANVLILIFGMLFLFIALFVGLLAIGVGETKVKLKDNSKVAV